jgi:hypothetical protein
MFGRQGRRAIREFTDFVADSAISRLPRDPSRRGSLVRDCPDDYRGLRCERESSRREPVNRTRRVWQKESTSRGQPSDNVLTPLLWIITVLLALLDAAWWFMNQVVAV